MTRSRGPWLVLLAALVGMGALCGVPHPPPVTIPPGPSVPSTAVVGVEVYKGDPEGDHKFPWQTVSLKTAANPTGPETTTDGAGNAWFTLGAGDYDVWVQPDGYTKAEQHVTMPAAPVGQTVRLSVLPIGPPPVTQRVHADGRVFRLEDGTIWRWKGVTAFLAYQQFLNGVDLTPQIAQWQRWGANTVRVLGMNAWPAPETFTPSAYGDRYFADLPRFADTLAAAGLRLEFTVFADAQIVIPSDGAQRAFLSRALAALGPQVNVFVEVCNEPFKNGVVVERFADVHSAGLLIASGRYPDESTGSTLATRDYATMHDDRSAEWPRKAKALADLNQLGWTLPDGSEFRPIVKPWVSDEPMGAAETDQPGRRSTVAADFEDYAAVCALFGAGATFHFEDGLHGRLPGPIQQAAGMAFFAGLDAIPIDAPLGSYTRGLLPNCPLVHDDATALRTFCQIWGSTATCVVVRKAYDLPVAQGAWRIVSMTGHDRHVVTLTRD